MAKRSLRKVAFVSSYLPTKCGIATFTSDLISNISLAAGDNFEPLVVAVHDNQDNSFADPVKFEVRRQVKNDYICAADYINFSHVDLVCVQHEYGLFGGQAGSYLNLLLDKINVPVISTMHTVLEDPDQDYRQATIDLCSASDKVVVMNKRGIPMLRDIYDIPQSKMILIPHGIPDLPFVDSSYYKHKFGMDARRTILTFGLLSPNKGIETMLEALPEIVKKDPSVLYIILGTTHPGVLRHNGEQYRFSLNRKVKLLGLQNNVIFHNRFVQDKELHNFLCAADLYVTPYENQAQLTSGTLAFAVGAGKAVISTPYWAAQELLDDERGKLVPFKDPVAMAKAVNEIIASEPLFYSMRRKAYDYGRHMTWPVVGEQYWKIMTADQIQVKKSSAAYASKKDSSDLMQLPEPPMEHLKRMTDNVGLFQHGKFILPDRNHGYCTDDNARAVIAMLKYYNQYGDPQAVDLLNTYLSFVYHAIKEDGTVHNFMTYDRQWLKGEPLHDALGRTIWALGAVIASPPSPGYIPVLKDCFDNCIKHLPNLSLRGKAYAVFGIWDYLSQFAGASDMKRALIQAALKIKDMYLLSSDDNWHWFEDTITYDNAVLPHALFIAAQMNDQEQFKEIALESANFLIDATFIDGHFSPVGCHGWYKKNGKRARYDQQPLEAASTIMMLKAAYDLTGENRFLKLQKKTFDWFLGDNDLHTPVYDFRSQGCFDGLEQKKMNLNQGAESLISFLLSLLAIVESFNFTNSANRSETAKLISKELRKISESMPQRLSDENLLEKLI